MSYILMHVKFEDFAKWKSVFDGNTEMRKKGGSKGARRFRIIDKPNEVVLLAEWESVESARKFSQSAELHEVMKQAGVAQPPEVLFLEEFEPVQY